MWGSTLPAAIDALVAVLKAAPSMAGVGLKDGPRVEADWTDAVITVGYRDEENNGTSAEAQLANEGLGVQPDREHFDILCAASALNGDAEQVATVRRRAYELLSIVGGVLAADKTLGGVVMSASIGEHTLRQDQTSAGAAATVLFTVSCDAFTQR